MPAGGQTGLSRTTANTWFNASNVLTPRILPSAAAYRWVSVRCSRVVGFWSFRCADMDGGGVSEADIIPKTMLPASGAISQIRPAPATGARLRNLSGLSDNLG